MDFSASSSVADDTQWFADVSESLERIGRSLFASFVAIAERIADTDDFLIREVWVDPECESGGKLKGKVVPGLGTALADLTTPDCLGAGVIPAVEALRLVGSSSGEVVGGYVSGSVDLAVISVFAVQLRHAERAIAATSQICDLAGQLLRRADANRLLETRLGLSQVLSNASAALADAVGPSAETLISEQLALVGSEIGCVVATIWDDHPDGKVHRSHIWVNPENGSVGDYPIEVIAHDHPISMAVHSLQSTASVDLSEYFDRDVPRQNQTLIVAPLMVEECVVGAVTFAFDTVAHRNGDAEAWSTAATGMSALVTQARKRAAAELTVQRGFEAEAAVGRIVRTFVEAGSSDFEQAMNDALRTLCDFVDARCIEYHGKGPGKSNIELLATRRSGSACDCRSSDIESCFGSSGECESCGRLTIPVGINGQAVGQLIFDMGDSQHDDKLMRKVSASAASLMAQFRRRCDAEVRLNARRDADAMLRDMATDIIGPEPDTSLALAKLRDGIGATHVSMWRENASWRRSGHARVECVARAGGGDGAGHISLPVSLIERFRQPGTAIDFAIDDVSRWLKLIVAEDLPPAPRCISMVTVMTGPDEAITLFVLSDGQSPANEARSDMLLKAAAMLAQYHARIAAEETFVAAFESAPSAITIRGEDRRLISCNQAYAEFIGRPREELLGGHLEDLLADPDYLEEFAEDLSYSEVPYRKPSGDVVWARARLSEVHLSGRTEPLMLSHISDITEERRLRNSMAHRATHDPLTDLPNRDHFFETLGTDLAAPDTAVIVADIDRFATINDTFGHQVGDMALVTCADRLRLALRPGDSICRLGGDEFAIHLAGVASPQEVSAVAARLLKLVRQPVNLDGHELQLTLSVGSAMAAGSSTTEDLVHYADAAMYRAKQTGRDQYVMFDDDLRNELKDHLAIESELREGLRTGQFEVYYQPDVDLESGEIRGTEALVRWHHPQRGLLSAGAFIDVAEHSGVIVELGRWVLEQAAKQAAAWHSEGHDIDMRANLSTRQLRPAVMAEIRDALLSAGLRPDQLCLEVTETAIMEDVEQSMRLLQEIHDLGVKLAIDDFGTGYSSLAYLKRFPVDVLKIDKAFVDGVGIDEQDTGIVDTVIRLGRALDLEVVAEGIENARQIDDLRKLGCKRGQGFYMARPAPADHISSLLSAQTRH